MLDPQTSHYQYAPKAFPPGLRAASFLLSTLVVGVILFEAAVAAAAMLA